MQIAPNHPPLPSPRYMTHEVSQMMSDRFSKWFSKLFPWRHGKVRNFPCLNGCPGAYQNHVKRVSNMVSRWFWHGSPNGCRRMVSNGFPDRFLDGVPHGYQNYVKRGFQHGFQIILKYFPNLVTEVVSKVMSESLFQNGFPDRFQMIIMVSPPASPLLSLRGTRCFPHGFHRKLGKPEYLVPKWLPKRFPKWCQNGFQIGYHIVF